MKKVAYHNGREVKSLYDLPVGWVNNLVVRRVYEKSDLPEYVTIEGRDYSAKAFIAMVKGMLNAELKIAAIKLVRDVLFWGLKESKDFVDNL